MASRSPQTLEWANSHQLGDDVASEVAKLKEQDGGEIQVSGSSELIQTLLRNDLVDEFHLIVFPSIVGSGKRFFGDGTIPRGLALQSITATATRGVVIWIVVADGAAFVRSVRGPTGKWFAAAAADGQATLEVGDRQLPVRVVPVADHDTIEAVSRAFLTKYTHQPLCAVDRQPRHAANHATARSDVRPPSPSAAAPPTAGLPRRHGRMALLHAAERREAGPSGRTRHCDGERAQAEPRWVGRQCMQ